MDFELSDEQMALRDAARDLIAKRWDTAHLRRALDQGPARLSGEVWTELVALGWVGIAVAEERGGSGGDLLTAAVLAEEAGRGLLPGPFLSAVEAVCVVDRLGDAARDELVAELCAGTRRATCAWEEPGGAWGPARPGTTVTDGTDTGAASGGGDGLRVSGTKILVPDAEGADLFVVSATRGDETVLVAVPAGEGVEIEAMRRFDGQDIAEVRFDVDVPAAALLATGAEAVSGAYDLGTLLAAADLLGVASAALDTTVAYAGQRVQFGRPIGSFQAIAHQLADVAVDVEIARSLVLAAALAADDPEARDEAPALISAAKAWASQTAVAACETAVHVHGGIGFTWELDVHLWLRRARAGAVSFGDATHHQDRIGTGVLR